MTRILLLGLGVLLVVSLLLAPQPAVQDQFGLALQTMAKEGALDLGTAVAAAGQPDGPPVRLALGEANFEGFPADWDRARMREQVERAIERAVNQYNKLPDGDEVRVQPGLEWLPGEEGATLLLDATIRAATERPGVSWSGGYRGAGQAAEVTFPPEDASGTQSYPGRTALLPPLLAILVAIAFRRVLMSLFAGVWLAAALLTFQGDLTSPWRAAPAAEAPLVAEPAWRDTARDGLVATGEGFLRTFDHFFWRELTDTFRFEMIGFVLFLCAAVGVMARSGGMAGLVAVVARIARGVRSSQFATYLMGLSIFFDDYANCILVGTTMRPVTDRLRIAREKLAFVVDATAAPVAAICMLSTWVAYEVSTFQSQLPSVGVAQSEAYSIFAQTLPYRYYAIFMLGFVLLNVLLQRDFGPMLKAERRARATGALVRLGGRPMVSDRLTRLEPRADVPPLARRAVLPILTVLLVTVGMIWAEGGGPVPWEVTRGGDTQTMLLPWQWQLPAVDTDQIREILSAGSGTRPILYGSFAGLVMALFLCLGLGSRIGLVAAWVLAAYAAEPGATALFDWLRDRLTNDGSSTAALYAAETLGLEADRTFQSVLVYFVFAAVFTVASIVIGFLASAFLEEERLPGGDKLAPVDAFRAALSSTQALFFAVLILFLAWMIGRACQELGTAPYLVALIGDTIPYWSLPLMLFLISCLVSFATGSAWSTMALVLPIVVVLAFHIGEGAEIGGMALMILSIGAVLEGSIFGDHCSPISDTTVLSSVASASDHIDHVRTQMPYAITVMVTALTVGYLPQALGWCSPWVSAGIGLGILFLILLIFGRNPNRGVPAAALAATPYPPLVAGGLRADPLAADHPEENRQEEPEEDEDEKGPDTPAGSRLPPWMK